MEPLYNGQVGAGDFVRYLQVSFIGRFHNILVRCMGQMSVRRRCVLFGVYIMRGSTVLLLIAYFFLWAIYIYIHTCIK